MPLHIYYSDRIEDLANHLKGALVKERETAGRISVFGPLPSP